MKIAALVHFSMPWRCAGSETVLHELLKAAVQAGHEATLWCTNSDSQRTWTGREPVEYLDGIKLVRVKNPLIGGQQVQRWRPDVVVSHHQHVMQALRVARTIGARSVYLTHNDMDLNARPLRAKPTLVIHNTEWVKKSLARYGPHESLVFHPPLTPDRHAVESTGDCVTLVNLNEHKGGRLFYELAEAQPDRKFLGVVGGHGQQIIRHGLSNVTIMEHGPDMKRVWSATRVLLMPSIYESYGLVAVEAGLNGIPTIANRTPGLLENIGAHGMFADRDDLTTWVERLERLDHEGTYVRASIYARERAALATRTTRDTLKTWLTWLDG